MWNYSRICLSASEAYVVLWLLIYGKIASSALQNNDTPVSSDDAPVCLFKVVSTTAIETRFPSSKKATVAVQY